MVKEVGEEALKIWAYQNFNKIKDELFEKFISEPESEESCDIELNSYYNNLLTLIYQDKDQRSLINVELEKLKSEKFDYYISEIAKLLKFRESEFERLLQESFTGLIDLYYIKEGQSGFITKSDALKKIFDANAVAASLEGKGKLLINERAIRIFNEFLDKKKKEVLEKVKECNNVLVEPIAKGLKNKNVQDKTIITFYADEREIETTKWDPSTKTSVRVIKLEFDIDVELLKYNVVLLLSPVELGYLNNEENGEALKERKCYKNYDDIGPFQRTVRPLNDLEFNLEFNAIEDVEGLKCVKPKLNKVPYKKEDATYIPLQEAEKIIRMK